MDVRVNGDELVEAKERLDTGYVYFHPKDAVKKLTQRPLLLTAIGLIVRVACMKHYDLVTYQDQRQQGYQFVETLKTSPTLRRYVADVDDVTVREWCLLVNHGYFTDKNPEMRLFRYDVGLRDLYDWNLKERCKVLSKMNKAANQARDKNRKVGKRINMPK